MTSAVAASDSGSRSWRRTNSLASSRAQSAVADVLAGMVGGPPVAELQHLQVLVDAVDPLVDADVVAVGPLRGGVERLKAVALGDLEVALGVPVEVVAAERRAGPRGAQFVRVVVEAQSLERDPVALGDVPGVVAVVGGELVKPGARHVGLGGDRAVAAVLGGRVLAEQHERHVEAERHVQRVGVQQRVAEQIGVAEVLQADPDQPRVQVLLGPVGDEARSHPRHAGQVVAADLGLDAVVDVDGEDPQVVGQQARDLRDAVLARRSPARATS